MKKVRLTAYSDGAYRLGEQRCGIGVVIFVQVVAHGEVVWDDELVAV